MLSLAVGVLFCVKSQAQKISDPGISSHNYKMPNKAKMAGVRPQQIVLVKQSFNAHKSSVHQTPKYATSPVTVISAKRKSVVSNINPLQSVGNYKAQAVYRPEEKSQAMMTCSL